ncbi:unnamed protein product [Medioppia subpectinata]|uniref:Succinate dehydrogenase assembly factor 2, mitochondrial n=1 Tax=Medioppia subpectinata TaxID=1979941 RepID=A0A7R9QD04_9ACAR|nr:unnamed protein product [Medioppia subpectinata]CAG2118130.1 unnamed protein product [Medioppia subpectinata]
MQFICRRSAAIVRQSLIGCHKSRLLSTKGNSSDDQNHDIYDPVSNEPEIPSSLRQRLESIDMKKKRLLYQSRKRGILENDLILGNFANKYLDQMSDKQLEMYDLIINMPSNDWELYYWSVGRKEVPKEMSNEVMDLLIEYTKNRDKEVRIRQPDV